MPGNQSNLEFSMRGNQLHIGRNGSSTHRIRLWPRPVAEEWKDHKADWERFYPEFRLIGYPLPKPKKKKKDANQLELALDVAEKPGKKAISKRQAYDVLRQTLPPSYGIALAPFKSHQWNLVSFLWRQRRFYELIRSNPALGFILANDREVNCDLYFEKMTLERLTGMKQQKLLELLDLPGTKKLVQIVRKIRPASAHPKLRGMIRYFLQDEETMKKLSHLKTINSGVLHLLGSVEEVRAKATPQLLDEISNNRPNDHYPFAAHQIRECLRWHTDLRPGQRFPRIQTLEALTTYHEELSGEVDRFLEQARIRQEQAERQARAERNRELEKMLRKPFPKPPVKGTPNIVPLQCARDLVEEGHLQHHCVGGYADRVRAGSCYIYQVLKPERATLSIIRSPGNQWSIGQLFAGCNKPVKPATRQAAENWLNNNQLGI